MRGAFWPGGLLALVLVTDGNAQVLQLPSFNSFSVDTTVVVPDSGPGRASAVKRGAAATTNAKGSARSRAMGIDHRAAGAAVRAEIHDPAEADAAALGANSHRGKSLGATREAAADSAPKSLAEIEREHARQSAARQQQALELVRKARLAKTAGKPSVARIYYDMAARQADRTLAQQIGTELRQLDRGAAPVKVSKTARATP